MGNKKGFASIVWVIIAAAIVVVVASQGKNAGLFSITASGDFVYCNSFEYQSCVLQKDTTSVSTILKNNIFDGTVDFKCLSDRCTITNRNSGNVNALFRLNGGSQFPLTFPFAMNINDSLRLDYGDGSTTLLYDAYNRHLKWCGSSPCSDTSAGNDVSGSSRCTFVLDKTVYGQAGQLISQPTNAGQSYTVPTGNSVLVKGSQFICGSKSSQCTADVDCSAGHTYLYNGLGAEAVGGNLQIYGCVNRGTAPSTNDLDYLPGIEIKPAVTQFDYGSKCEVKSAATVQCVPGSNTCGSNAVCDVTSFTCKPTGSVKCTNDNDCGLGETYDQNTKTFYKFSCSAPNTLVSACTRVATRTVQCAYNSECPQNWYCDIDNKCKEYTSPKQSCPSACCVGDPRYFDKPAPPGNVCCPNGQSFAPTIQQCVDVKDACGFLGIDCLLKGLFSGLNSIFFAIVIILVLYLGIKLAGHRR